MTQSIFGLFRKNAGTIYNLRLLNPQVEIASGKAQGCRRSLWFTAMAL